MATRLDDSVPTRQSLLGRLKDLKDQESWKDFFDTYWKLIYSVAIKAGLNDAEAQDVVQETIIAAARQMPDFRYDASAGSFKNWLLVITRRRVIDYLRKSQRQPARGASRAAIPQNETPHTATVEKIPDPAGAAIEVIWDEEWKKNLLQAAIERVRQRVDPKQFQIFDCRVLKEWPVREVASTLGVNIAKVYMDSYRVSTLIRKELKSLEKKMV